MLRPDCYHIEGQPDVMTADMLFYGEESMSVDTYVRDAAWLYALEDMISTWRTLSYEY